MGIGLEGAVGGEVVGWDGSDKVVGLVGSGAGVVRTSRPTVAVVSGRDAVRVGSVVKVPIAGVIESNSSVGTAVLNGMPAVVVGDETAENELSSPFECSDNVSRTVSEMMNVNVGVGVMRSDGEVNRSVNGSTTGGVVYRRVQPFIRAGRTGVDNMNSAGNSEVVCDESAVGVVKVGTTRLSWAASIGATDDPKVVTVDSPLSSMTGLRFGWPVLNIHSGINDGVW